MAFNVQTHPVTICLSIALVSIYALRTIKSYRKGKLPPGPKGLPFLGNLFQLSLMPWKEFEVWKKQYGTSTHASVIFDPDSVLNAGPLVYLTVGGQGILVLNTHQVAADLLDRRGHIYSDRPRMISKCGCCRYLIPYCYMTFSGERDTLERADGGFAQVWRNVHPIPFYWNFLDD